jgi:DnaK suppressor protein
MPSKKSNKAAKRPGKATPKKATHKATVAKKAARPPTKAKPIVTSKVTVKPTKPAAKPVSAKPAVTKTPRAKAAVLKPVPTLKHAPTLKPVPNLRPVPSLKAVPTPVAPKAVAQKPAPIKFDPRPLVMPRALQNDEDSDAEGAASASLLAGPRNVKPYIARRGEQYMNKEQLEHFARILQNWKRDLMVEVDRTVLHMKDEAANFPDPNDRATQEEEFSLELRTRDRERKLIRKIDEALKRIEDGSYGYCLETGEEIGIKRLEARPVATLSVEAQERRERREKQYGDRDDRYR